jgi:CHAT domain
MDTRCLSFKLQKADTKYRVRLCVDNQPPLEGPFQVELGEGSRIAAVIARIENDTCTRDDLRDLGSELWTGLAADNLRRAVMAATTATDTLFQIRLELPPELEQVPWEVLYDMDGARFLAAEPGWCVIRDPPIDRLLAPALGARKQELRLLAVIPEGSGLRVEEELRNLKLAVKQVENLQISDLRGRVTPEKILERLSEIAPDVFHFVGHGELDSAGDFTIRLNSEDDGNSEFWAQAEQFTATLARHTIKLAVFNCCYGGHSTRNSLSGLGPLLLRRGIQQSSRCVIPSRNRPRCAFPKHSIALCYGARPAVVSI